MDIKLGVCCVILCSVIGLTHTYERVKRGGGYGGSSNNADNGAGSSNTGNIDFSGGFANLDNVKGLLDQLNQQLSKSIAQGSQGGEGKTTYTQSKDGKSAGYSYHGKLNGGGYGGGGGYSSGDGYAGGGGYGSSDGGDGGSYAGNSRGSNTSGGGRKGGYDGGYGNDEGSSNSGGSKNSKGSGSGGYGRK